MAYNIMPFGPLSYRGAVAIPFINKTFPPNSTNIQFPVPTIWVDTSSKDAYILVSVDLGTAEWVPIGGLPGQVEKFNVDASTPPGTDPVVPDASQSITVTGGQVASGVVGTNVIRTDSLAASTYTIEIQRSLTSATPDLTLNGVSHFDSARFTCDADGFVSLNGAGVGETITGDSGGPLSPTAGNWNILGGAGCSTSGSGSTLTINVTGSGFDWVEVTGTSQNMAVNTAYILNNVGLVTATLPATAAVGDIVWVVGKGSGGWRIAQGAGQTIHFGSANTSTGAGGRLDSTNQYDAIQLVCTTANTDWTCTGVSQGNITVT